MRLFIILIFALASMHQAYSQTRDFEEIDSYPLQYENISKFKLLNNVQTLDFQFQQNSSNYNILRIDSTFDFNSEELNKKLFSNFKVVNYSFIDYTDYLRGCGPLDDGITKSVNGGDVIISNIFDNLVNNYLLRNLIFKNN